MREYKVLRRLIILSGYLENSPGLSKAQLIDRYEEREEESISERTIERDFKALRTDFLIDVYYDRARNGYYIREESQREVQRLLTFFTKHLLAEIMKIDEKDREQMRKILSAENPDVLKATLDLIDNLTIIKESFSPFDTFYFMPNNIIDEIPSENIETIPIRSITPREEEVLNPKLDEKETLVDEKIDLQFENDGFLKMVYAQRIILKLLTNIRISTKSQ